MGRPKREDDPLSSGDEDIGLLSRKFVDIGEIPKGLDLSVPPTSGIDFLRRTRLESMKYPNVCVADMNAGQFAEKQTVKVESGSGIQPAPEGFAPSMELQMERVNQFEELRLRYFASKRKLQKEYKKPSLPGIGNSKAWLSFCFGPLMKDVSECSSSENDCDVESGSSTEEGQPPLMRNLIWLSQPKIEKLLSYHVLWLRKFGFSHDQGRWIYALMTAFDKPLTPDGCNILRGLARECASIRSKLTDPADDKLEALNMFICIVAHFFDQGDMVDTVS